MFCVSVVPMNFYLCCFVSDLFTLRAILVCAWFFVQSEERIFGLKPMDYVSFKFYVNVCVCDVLTYL